jgi:hypothetical protein
MQPKKNMQSVQAGGGDLVDRIAQVRSKAASRERASPTPAPRSISPMDKVVQLPLWREQNRGVPNAIARSALFTAARKNSPRKQFQDKQIASVDGVEIFYTGEELRTEEDDVFLQLVHLARTLPLGNKVKFSAYSMLKTLSLPTNKGAYERLEKSIWRLTACAVKIRFDPGSGKHFYGGALVQEFFGRDDGDREWGVVLNPRMIALFGSDAYTQIAWEQSLKLPPLAKKLHRFYFTHRKPYGYKVVTLKEILGSDAKRLDHFRERLKDALRMLEEIGFLRSWRIDPRTDVVTVERILREETALGAA